MNVSGITMNNECNPRRNMFIKYSNSFMSMMNNNSNTAIEKTMHNKNIEENKINKSMGIETLTIFPKQVIDGKTIITA